MSLSTIPEALAALAAGKPVIVADDENRENEGDVVLSAQLATPEWIAWTVRWSSGFICAPMPAESYWFEVSLIPETLEATTLGALAVGDRVNLETDILARHVQRLLSFTPQHPSNEGGSA